MFVSDSMVRKGPFLEAELDVNEEARVWKLYFKKSFTIQAIFSIAGSYFLQSIT